jgi:Oxidoreductase family, NAD-binding Rossmann fold
MGESGSWARSQAMNSSPPLQLDYQPKLPVKMDYGIGIIGAGQSINRAHLPAYRNAEFRVLAITDIDSVAANSTAAQFNIPRVCRSVDELLEMSNIDTVDISVPVKPIQC